jgi:thiol-disulfide isomerase/thioredoxin
MKTALLLMMMAMTTMTQKSEILTHETFKEVYDRSEIKKSEVEDIDTTDIGVIVVLATWCSDSVEHVPVFMRAEEHLSFEFVDYFDVERGFQSDEGVVQDFKIERVPTFVFMRNGEEIGRIVETPEKSIVEDIRKICGTVQKK